MPNVHAVLVTDQTPSGDNTNVGFFILTIGGDGASGGEDGVTIPGDTAEEDFDTEVLRQIAVDYPNGDIFYRVPGIATRYVKGS